MNRPRAIVAAFGGAFALALALLAAFAVLSRSAADERIYKLDATYHHLPPKLVAELLAHPPKRAPLAPYLRCETAEMDGEEIQYCICFDRETCAGAPHFPRIQREYGFEDWTCTAPLGAIDDRGMAVCRARGAKVVIVG